MEIEGRIINVLQKQEGTSNKTGNHWASQEYVIETHEQYPRKCCFRVFGEDRITAMNIQVGEEVATGINDIATPGRQTSNDVYTLDGRLIRHHADAASQMPKGIYLVNGRKVVVR